MANANFFGNFLKGGFCLLFLYSSSCLGLTNSEPDKNAKAQQQFIIGINLMLDGQNDKAVDVLSNLYKETGAIRVKLEWARAAFLARQYELSQTLFEDMQASDIPDIVRFNIGLYLSEISKIAPKSDYGLRFGRDTNPFNLTAPQEIKIYGLPFRYEPPSKRESLYGINFFANTSLPVAKISDLRIIGGLDITQYARLENNKYAANLAADYRIESLQGLGLRLGSDIFYQKNQNVLNQKYINLQHRRDFAYGLINAIQTDFRLTNNKYPISPEGNGLTQSVTIGVSKNLSSSIQLGAAIYIDKNTTSATSLSYNTKSISVYTKKYFHPLSSIIQFNIMKADRSYKGIDELFEIFREDNRLVASASITRDMKFFGLYPSIELGFERFSSNIPINSYNRRYLNIQLKKSFN